VKKKTIQRNRFALFLLSLFVLMVSAALLISGSAVLTYPLSESLGLPWGTIITWLGMIALPAAIYFGLRRIFTSSSNLDRAMHVSLRVFMLLAVLWLPLSFLLSGNLSFSFANKPGFQGGQLAMRIFWYYNIFVVAGPLALLLVYGILRLFSGKRTS